MTIRERSFLFLAVCVAALFASSAFAASVTKLDDSGAGSLRQAIAETSAGGTIDFAVKGVIKLTGGELTIDKNIIISGPGAGSVSVSGSKSSRVFNITAGDVTISGLTICDGKTTGSPARGGAIYNNGKLTLKSVTVKDSQAVGSGGQSGYGGGIYNNATLTAVNCLISGNTAQGGDGASGGNGARGGGICAVGATAISGCTISGNTAAGGNSSGAGRAGDGEGGGVFFYNNCSGAVEATTFSANKARAGSSTHASGQGGFASGGGAIQNWVGASGTRTYTNCTFSGNICEGGTGGMADSCSRGGGAWETSTAQFIHCTFASNKTVGKFQEGGGLYSAANAGEGPSIQNSIFIGNTAASGADLRGNVKSQDYNLIGTASGCTLAGAVAQNIVGKDPKLGKLANNGGPTATHAVAPGSAAVDVIPPANCSVKTDQRGLARPIGANADIGAFEADTLPPNAAAIAPVTAGPTNSKTVSFTVSFNEDVRNFDAAADLVLKETGTVSHAGAAIKGGPREYTVDINGIKGNGTISLTVNTKSDVQDLTGLALASSVTSAPIAIDNLPTAVTAVTCTTPNPTNGDKVTFAMSFNKGVQKLDQASDLTITKGGSVAYGAVSISGGPQNFTIDITGVSGDGTITVALNPKSDVRDVSGNIVSSTIAAPVVTVDHSAPTAAIAPATPSPTNADAVAFKIVFSEPVGASFALDDIALTGTLTTAATAQIGGTDPEYTLSVTPSDPNANGDAMMSIGAGVADAAGNALAPVGPSEKIVVDNVPPSVAIAPAGAAVTNADSAAFSVTFSEAVAPTFALDDIALTGTLASAATVQLGGEDPAYTATVTPNDPNANGTLGIVVATGANDLAGNALPAAVGGPLETFDNVAPTVAVSAVTPSPTNADTVAFSAVFSEPVAAAFAVDDIALTGTLAASATAQIGGADPSFTVNVTLTDPQADGTIGIVVNTDVTDAAGNKLAAGAASPLVTLDNQPVAAKITPVTPAITGAGGVTYKVEFSRPLPSAFTPENVVMSGTLAGTVSVQPAGQDNTYTVTVTPTDPKASGTVGIAVGPGIAGPAGNPIIVEAPASPVTVDATAPTLTITPVTPSPTRADAVAFNLLFSEPVGSTFALEDIGLTGTLGAAATAQLAGLDPGYTAVVIPDDPNATGTIALTIGTSVADAAGNAPAAPVTSSPIFVDNTPPDAKIEILTPNAAGAAEVVFGVTFNEPVAPSFNTDNLALAGTLAGDSSAKIAGADPVYRVTVSLGDPNASGTIGIIIGAGVMDAAGNAYPGGASELCTK